MANRRMRLPAMLLLLFPALFFAACESDAAALQDTKDAANPSGGRVIVGEEALALYGLAAPDRDQTAEPPASPEPWFPRRVWVAASVLPYDDPDPIMILPVYADPALGEASTWIGDLQARSSVMLLSVDAAGRACFIEGMTLQGWQVQGWVACSRLLFNEPTPVSFD